MNKKEYYDVCVIGGGPSGMMAAGQAASSGASVLLIEKNNKLGKKLLITGGGRCNVTNAKKDFKELSECYGNDGKALLSLFSDFSSQQTISFFETQNVPIKIEELDRAFPKSNQASSIRQALVNFMSRHRVRILTGESLVKLNVEPMKTEDSTSLSRVTSVLTDRYEIFAKEFILATGGLARPETGSTGEVLTYLKNLGITVHFPEPSLVPIYVKEKWPSTLQGIAFDDLEVSVFARLNGGDKLLTRERGKILFTHLGLSGPLILTLSQKLEQWKKEYAPHEIIISLNIINQEFTSCDKFILEQMKVYGKKSLLNFLRVWLSKRISEVVLDTSSLFETQLSSTLTREERQRLTKSLTSLDLRFKKLFPLAKAVVTSGGVDLKEVHFKSMRLKKFENLSALGDMLNFDRPSGGYSLQICWSTGFRAGIQASQRALAKS